MTVIKHPLSAPIHAAAAGDDARLLARLGTLLAELRETRGRARDELARRVRACEEELALHLERSGRSLLAGAMLHRPLDGEVVEL